MTKCRAAPTFRPFLSLRQRLKEPIKHAYFSKLPTNLSQNGCCYSKGVICLTMICKNFLKKNKNGWLCLYFMLSQTVMSKKHAVVGPWSPTCKMRLKAKVIRFFILFFLRAECLGNLLPKRIAPTHQKHIFDCVGAGFLPLYFTAHKANWGAFFSFGFSACHIPRLWKFKMHISRVRVST